MIDKWGMVRGQAVDKAALIEQILAAAASSCQGTNIEFARALYWNVPPEDLAARDPGDLLRAAASLWDFLQFRPPGRAKLRVMIPGSGAQSWHGGRTVVQVANDDMPFLVDSVTLALNARNLLVHLVIHPILNVERDASGRLIRLLPDSVPGARESLMQVEVVGAVEEAARLSIEQELETVLANVRSVVVDHALMASKAERIAQEIGRLRVDASEASEAAAFLDWLTDRNFTFLGYREYRIEGETVPIIPGSGLGLLRDDEYLVFDGLRSRAGLSQFLGSRQIVTISRSSRVSTVHRRSLMATVSTKRFDEAGAIVGQRLFVGLFTSQSYQRPLPSIPILRRKIQHVIARSGFVPDSHDAKALQHILDTFPRDELFQFDEDALFDTAMGVLNLQERQRVALFLRHDPFGRFVSCLVYVPRDRYSTEVRRRMGTILAESFQGTIDSEATHLDQSVLARIEFVVGTGPYGIPAIDPATLEQRLIEAARTWEDRFAAALAAGRDAAIADRLLRRYGRAFPAAYTERTEPTVAVDDAERIERVLAGHGIGSRMEAGVGDALSLRIFQPGQPAALSDILPVLENFGLRVVAEIPFEVRPDGVTGSVWVQDFELVPRVGAAFEAEAAHRFEDALPSVWTGAIEDDGFNRLVMLTDLTAREVEVLRAYCKILRQAGSTFSQGYMEDTLALHAAIAHQLFRLFAVQFDPAWTGEDRNAAASSGGQAIEEALMAVSNLDEDRILRGFAQLIGASLRTNFYQPAPDGTTKPYLSIKLASYEIDLLPLPRPLLEVYVYSPRMEGCHLRGGRVARGGIRWSDRKEDFRTEILGLMKAQMVKNAVIVPVGAKGGFVIKNPPTAGGQDALMQEVVTCYQFLIRGLLDITDNYQGEAVVSPASVVRRDGDDPYLVVAADKGTATFSDIANALSQEYGFWLGDAFASGGSVGYDHKAMGITSRGAWEAVKRHFRELDRDIQTQDFTCVGVGDMSGDVFGNGMLLSRHIRLIGAFNHRHVFVDPDPDPEASWQERKRLFGRPGSGWNDYDPAVLSAGGCVYPRDAKAITLSPEAQARLGLESATMTPAELVRALLRQPVDLLWFGGIGTYVKASNETQADAGDRANDALRVNGAELRAKVVGEGANLAVTQRGRIEYALSGGRINTDAIDNSAGVDTSDHEVNIKIGTARLIASGHLDAARRPQFLASMTDEVAALVLRHNYLQTLALSLAEAEAPALLDPHARLMRMLERQGRLDREVECLPDDETLGQRASTRRGLTRPELAVLLAYAKTTLYADLLASDLPDDARLETRLLSYFPPTMRSLSADDLKSHRLRREIVSTVVANALVNRMGPSFVADAQARSGQAAVDVARAWLIMHESFDLTALWAEIEALDNRIAANTQTALFLAVQHVSEQACCWFLQSGMRLDIAARVGEFAPGFAALRANLVRLLPETERVSYEKRRDSLVAKGIKPGLAERIVGLESLGMALDVISMDGGGVAEIVEIGRAYFVAGARLGLLALRRQAREVPVATPWERMAATALADGFAALQRAIVQRVLAEGQGSLGTRLDRWIDRHAARVAQLGETLAEIHRVPTPDLAMLVVAERQVRALAAA